MFGIRYNFSGNSFLTGTCLTDAANDPKSIIIGIMDILFAIIHGEVVCEEMSV